MSAELVRLLEREAAAERERLLAGARAEADATVAGARSEAEEHMERQRIRLQAEAATAAVRARSAANLRQSALVLRAKEEEIARVFARAEAELASFVGDSRRYPAVLRRLLEEGLRAIGGRAVVAVNPADQAVAEALIAERSREADLRADPAVKGGVRASTPDGRFVVTNTLASRLARARPALAAEVAAILWE